ncbi:MAG TPA: hypothetical protein VG206_14935 [Terriglobia bacterium]|nr:hypothetical protein [Terriglobia bacterium]
MPTIAMMQAAHARYSGDVGGTGRPSFDSTASQRLLVQGIMNAIFAYWTYLRRLVRE